VGDSEDEVFWRGFLTGLKRRGLSGVRLVISDQHSGLVAALTRSFQGAAHQRCRVHFARNLLALVPKTHTDMAAAVFRTIFAQPDPAAVAAGRDEARTQLAARFPKIGTLTDEAKAEVLAFTAFPRAHWPKIWSTNPPGRVNKEICECGRCVGLRQLPGSVLVIARDPKRDQAPSPGRGHLSQRRRRHPARRRHPRRHARRMAVKRPPWVVASQNGWCWVVWMVEVSPRSSVTTRSVRPVSWLMCRAVTVRAPRRLPERPRAAPMTLGSRSLEINR
jgi:transposase-like protein